jgi:ACS family pantothenate transporter-like MFS transporter
VRLITLLPLLSTLRTSFSRLIQYLSSAVPICLAGFFLLPDTPATTQTRLLSAEERAYAAARVDAHSQQGKFDRTLFRRVFARWHVYVFSLLW